MDIPELTPEQRERFRHEHVEYWKTHATSFSDFTESEEVWCDARAYSEAIPYPCQKCGTPVVDIGVNGDVTLQCPECGWIPVQVEEINGVPM